MSFGMELIFMLVLGILILGPKRLHTMLAHVARAKAELENATRGFKSQLAAEFDALPAKSETDGVLDPAKDTEHSFNSEKFFTL